MTEGNERKKQALFSDETREYVCPYEPEAGEETTIRFRTAAAGADSVCLVLAQTLEEVPMEKKEEKGLFDYYTCSVVMPQSRFSYYFRIQMGGEMCFYHKTGISSNTEGIVPFAILPGFHTPEWAKGAIMYQIFTDRFRNGCKENDVTDGEYLYVNGQPVSHVEDWDAPPEALDVNRFYGGDLQGILEKLDYIKSLGVAAIYLNPIFVSPSNHKYDSQDYDYIDPHFGVILKDTEGRVAQGQKNSEAKRYIERVTSRDNLEASNALFAQLVKAAHQRGIRVILDGVFNHCGSFHKWMDHERIYEGRAGFEPGAYLDENSPYHDFFHFNGGSWPENNQYDGWWGYETLPKLNYEESEALCSRILGIGEKWVSAPYHADGWRLDVAADLGRSEAFNHQFWKRFRAAVKKKNPDAVILAEHYGDPQSWLSGDEWDTVMNYDAFMEPLTWFLTGMEKHSDKYEEARLGDAEGFFAAMTYNMSRFTAPSLLTAMNELSNHDHSRFLTRTNHTAGRTGSLGAAAADAGVRKGVLRMAVLVQMTWPGAPTIYYGDEAGLCGWTDPDSRRCYPWGKEDLELIEFHKYMASIHNRNQALKTGSWKKLYAQKYIIAYGRFAQENRLMAALNIGEIAVRVEIPVWEIGVAPEGEMERIMMTAGDCYNSGKLRAQVKDGMLSVELPPESALLWKEVIEPQEIPESEAVSQNAASEEKVQNEKKKKWTRKSFRREKKGRGRKG